MIYMTWQTNILNTPNNTHNIYELYKQKIKKLAHNLSDLLFWLWMDHNSHAPILCSRAFSRV